jgi:trehalose-phosphatase
MTTPSLTEKLAEIGRRIDGASHIFLGLDFDGTLTPIFPRPDDVVLAEAVRELLVRLARLPKLTVMIVSGRALSDVTRKVGLPELIYAGNHGLEIKGPGLEFMEPTAAAQRNRMSEFTRRLRERLKDVPGAMLEWKGLTVSVHYRNVAPAMWDVVRQAVREVVVTDDDSVLVGSGRRIWEIRPAVPWHKGHALGWIIQHVHTQSSGLLLFLGDDRTDEDAFATYPDAVTVKVGVTDAPTSARYRLPHPDAVRAFLEWLLDRLTA